MTMIVMYVYQDAGYEENVTTALAMLDNLGHRTWPVEINGLFPVGIRAYALNHH